MHAWVKRRPVRSSAFKASVLARLERIYVYTMSPWAGGGFCPSGVSASVRQRVQENLSG